VTVVAVSTTLAGVGDGGGNALDEAVSSCGDRDGEVWSYTALAPAGRFGGVSAALSGSRTMVTTVIWV